MAIPLQWKKTDEARKANAVADLERRLAEARLENGEALLAFYKLIGVLHEKKVFDLLTGAVMARDPIIEKVTSGLDSREMINATRNVMTLTRLMGHADPDVLHAFANNVDELRSQPSPRSTPGLFATMWSFLGHDARRAHAATAAVLNALGRALMAKKVH
jgi:uncharacterized protein YjgD (DUF1641 family)